MGLGEKHVLYRPNSKMSNSSIIYKVGHYTGALDVVFFRTCQSLMAPLLLGASDLHSPGALDASLLACFRCARPEARPLSFSRASPRSLNHPNITPRSTLQPHAVSLLSANAAGDMAKKGKNIESEGKTGRDGRMLPLAQWLYSRELESAISAESTLHRMHPKI